MAAATASPRAAPAWSWCSTTPGPRRRQWNQFTEIAVKRVLTRDGTSSYFINNQPVRRRDVQDVFLGTGLATRLRHHWPGHHLAHHRESKPLKSCGSSSKKQPASPNTKERRRETENRLKDTRENLTASKTSCASWRQPGEAGEAGRGRVHLPQPAGHRHARCTSCGS